MKENMVTLSRQTYPRALILKAKLELEGIECFLSNVQSNQGEVKVMIYEEDLLAASRVLEKMQFASGTQKEESVAYLRSHRRIMVPVDFSEHSRTAASYAMRLSRKLKAEIKLINAYYDPAATPQPYYEGFAFPANFHELVMEMEEESDLQLNQLADQLLKEAEKNGVQDLKLSYDLTKGMASEVILGFAEEFKPGLIVMGTHGSTGGKNRIGSVTAKIAEKASVPVLTIPANYDMANYRDPKNVLYASNFDSSDIHSIQKLTAFLRPFSIKLFCIHVGDEVSESFDEANMRKLSNYFKQDYPEYNIECGLVESLDVLDGLNDFVKQMEIDVVALSMRKRNIFQKLISPSFTRKLLFHTDIPLLIFQASR